MNHAFMKYSGLKEQWNTFVNKYMLGKYRNLGVTIRALFPVLFNREILEKAGYAEDFKTRSATLMRIEVAHDEELINNFIWLDGDLVIMKDLNDLYQQFSMVKFNVRGIPQPTIASVLFWGTNNRYHANFHNRFDIKQKLSGGVVLWNLMSFREQSFNPTSFFPTYEEVIQKMGGWSNEMTEEFFIENLTGFCFAGFKQDVFFENFYKNSSQLIKPKFERFILDSKFNAFTESKSDIGKLHIIHWDTWPKPWNNVRAYLLCRCTTDEEKKRFFETLWSSIQNDEFKDFFSFQLSVDECANLPSSSLRECHGNLLFEYSDFVWLKAASELGQGRFLDFFKKILKF